MEMSPFLEIDKGGRFGQPVYLRANLQPVGGKQRTLQWNDDRYLKVSQVFGEGAQRSLREE